jgi:hypothetical protein
VGIFEVFAAAPRTCAVAANLRDLHG